jgi:hypothetical protein
VTTAATASTKKEKKKHRTRSDSHYSHSSNHQPLHDIITSHSSKHGMYMVSSRNISQVVDSQSLRDDNGIRDMNHTPSVEQYCLQKVKVRLLFDLSIYIYWMLVVWLVGRDARVVFGRFLDEFHLLSTFQTIITQRLFIFRIHVPRKPTNMQYATIKIMNHIDSITYIMYIEMDGLWWRYGTIDI